MKLTSWLLRVKQARRNFLLGLAISITVALGLGLAWLDDSDVQQRIQLFGGALASGLATLAVEPLTQRDQIHLGVLANRLAELTEVSGVSIYTVNNEMLAVSGNIQRGLAFTQPIVQGGSIVGYVRIQLTPAAAFAENASSSLLAVSVLIVLLVPLALFGLSELRLPGRLHSAKLLGPDAARTETEDVPARLDEPEVPHYLLVLNLFNQLSLTREQCERELAHASIFADEIAGIYYARVSELTGTGLLLEFDDTADADRPFQVICAAFALAQLLLEAETWGTYRLGLHVIELPRSRSPAPDVAEIADTALLSALAKPSTLAVSAELYDRIGDVERFNSQRMSNPLLTELESTPPAAWLIDSLDPAHQSLIAAQVSEIADAAGGYPVDSTSRESTF